MTADTLIALAQLSLRFGTIERATLHEDGETAETDSTHTVMLILVACPIAGELGLDVGRVAQLAAVHDLAETYAGDTNSFKLSDEGRRAKKAAEELALARLRQEFQEVPWLLDALEEYETHETEEAWLVRYVDKILPKATHALNSGAAIRRMGHDVETLVAEHRRQGAALAEEYPELAARIGPLFEAVAQASEDAMRAGDLKREG